MSKNRPRVTMVTGSVRMTKTGFTSRFKRLSTTATMTAVIKESTETLGNILARMMTAIALKRILTINFMIYFIKRLGKKDLFVI